MTFPSPFIVEKNELLAFIGDDVTLVTDELSDYDAKDLHYRFIERAFNRVGFGLTLKRHGSPQYAMLLKDASEPGCYRFQEFDRHGFFGHQTVKTCAELLYQVVTARYWYPIEREQVETMMQTKTWQAGSMQTNLIQKLNNEQITYSEYEAQLKELSHV